MKNIKKFRLKRCHMWVSQKVKSFSLIKIQHQLRFWTYISIYMYTIHKYIYVYCIRKQKYIISWTILILHSFCLLFFLFNIFQKYNFIFFQNYSICFKTGKVLLRLNIIYLISNANISYVWYKASMKLIHWKIHFSKYLHFNNYFHYYVYTWDSDYVAVCDISGIFSLQKNDILWHTIFFI